MLYLYSKIKPCTQRYKALERLNLFTTARYNSAYAHAITQKSTKNLFITITQRHSKTVVIVLTVP
ncbi:hypothetical protein DEU39_3500 [Chryseobacterium sp. AG363]|nr:hypothetical protein DEU39_3500 [Chryseobacterium sp. AG363]